LFELVAAAMTTSTWEAFADAAGPVVQGYIDVVARRGHDPLRAAPVSGLTLDLVRDLRRVNLGRVVAASTPRGRSGGDGSRGPVRTDFVPQLVPERQYDEHILEFMPGTARTTGRRFAALSVARLAGATGWGDAAVRLNLPPRIGVRVADVVGRRIADPSRYWDGVRMVLGVLAEQEVDYRRREAVLATLTDVPRPVWLNLSGETSFRLTPQRSRHGAAWAWSAATGGYWGDSPSAQGWWPTAATRESRVEGYRSFVKGAPSSVLPGLTEWALDAAAGPLRANGVKPHAAAHREGVV
jgi:hypothetical protein